MNTFDEISDDVSDDLDVEKGEKNETDESPPKRYHLALFLPDTSLDREIVRIIQRMLDEEIESEPSKTRIDLWIDSPGGDAHAAYKLALDLRSRCSELNAVIPDYAKSAATLLALAARNIYMSPSAELGPLDTQIEHPDKEGVIVSALDVANSLKVLGMQAIELVITGGKYVLDLTDLTRIEVLRSSLRFASRYTRPVISKLDPSLIHRGINQLKVAQRYAQILLSSRVTPEPDSETIQEEAARRIAHRLVNTYPDHGYVISYGEACDMGLPVKLATEYDRYIYAHIIHSEHIKADENAILLIPDDDLLNQVLDTEPDTKNKGDSDEASSDQNIQGDKEDVAEGTATVSGGSGSVLPEDGIYHEDQHQESEP
jgi:hypothetical protein